MNTMISKAVNTKPQSFATALGWFSIGLGLAEILGARRISRGSGTKGSETLLQGYGVRELVNGVGLLLDNDNRERWMWGRVGGDALDFVTLAAGLLKPQARKSHLLLGMVAVAGVTAVDLACAQALVRERKRAEVRERGYGERSGFPRDPETMRGAAKDFRVPDDMKKPEPLKDWGSVH